MSHFHKLLVLSLFLPFISYSQSNFKPGYVVRSQGDTLRGLIDYQDWGNNPKQFRFKNSGDLNNIEQYNTSSAFAFNVDGFEYFQRAIVSLSQDSYQADNLSVGIDSAKILDTVFLRALVIGKNLTLFAYKDRIKERYLISDAGASPVELVYHRYLDPSQTTSILTQDTYIRQLQKLAALYQPDNTKLVADIQNASYDEKDLIKILTKINGLENAQKTSADRNSSRLFIGAGINLANITASGYVPLADAKSSSSLFPLVNIGMDFYFNKNVGRLLARVEFYLTGNKSSFVYNGVASTAYTQTFSFSQYTASFNPQLLYNVYNSEQTKVYIAGGVAVDYAVYSNKQNNIVYFINGKEASSATSDFPSVQSIYFKFTTKIGVSINHKFEIYFGYDPPATITNNVVSSFNLTSYRAGIIIPLGK